MSTRKRHEPPYSDRHVRRLKAARRTSFFNELNADFDEYLDSAIPNPQNDNEISADGSNEIFSISKYEEDVLRTFAILHSTDQCHSLSEPPGDVTKKKASGAEISTDDISTDKNSEKLQHSDTDTCATQEKDIENDINWDILLWLLQDEDEQDESEDIDASSEPDELDDDIGIERKNAEFTEDLQQWCVKYVHTLPHAAINDLLGLLNKNTDASFPKDARTLLKTPRFTEVSPMGEGEYCDYSLKHAALTFATELIKKQENVKCLELLVNIDGAPLANTSEKGVWIISCSESRLKNVELIGIYHGKDKPKDCNVLLKKFVDDLQILIREEIECNLELLQVKLHALICDAPAKAYVLNVKSHSGYWSCTKCDIRGTYNNKLIFPGPCGNPRTDEGLKAGLYKNDGINDGYQLGTKRLSDIPDFGLVTNVPLDYIHLVCLGIMLKLIELWLKGPITVRLSENQRRQISDQLHNLRNYLPFDFSKKPSQFKNVKRLWKAHELRQFLLYTGPIVLLNVLREDLYKNFLHLHVAITILINPVLCKDARYLNFCDYLLQKFVEDFTEYYGLENVTHNVHNLLHLVEDVRKFGPVDNFSSFRYENHIGKTKKLLRKGEKPLQQIARRLTEIYAFKEYTAFEIEEDFVLEKPHSDGPMLHFHTCLEQFQILRRPSFRINCSDHKNSCVLLKEGIYVQCMNFVKTQDGSMHIIGEKLNIVDDLYSEPIRSISLNIAVVQSSETLQAYSCESILAKLCRMPFEDHFVVQPMMHSYCESS